MESTEQAGGGEPVLSLAEWLALCLICEEPRHGFAIARLLDSDGSMGRIWRVPKPVVYRALQRLEHLGLVRSAELQPSSLGPARLPVDATESGRELAADWLSRPAATTAMSGRNCWSSSRCWTARAAIRARFSTPSGSS